MKFDCSNDNVTWVKSEVLVVCLGQIRASQSAILRSDTHSVTSFWRLSSVSLCVDKLHEDSCLHWWWRDCWWSIPFSLELCGSLAPTTVSYTLEYETVVCVEVGKDHCFRAEVGKLLPAGPVQPIRSSVAHSRHCGVPSVCKFGGILE